LHFVEAGQEIPDVEAISTRMSPSDPELLQKIGTCDFIRYPEQGIPGLPAQIAATPKHLARCQRPHARRRHDRTDHNFSVISL
jgi:hypothetical protein